MGQGIGPAGTGRDRQDLGRGLHDSAALAEADSRGAVTLTATDGAEYVCEFDRTETESVAWFAPKDVRTLIAQGEVPDGLSVTALGMAFALGRL